MAEAETQGVEGELPGIPAGSVPVDVRNEAEKYVREAIAVDAAVAKLKERKNHLMTIMKREKCLVVVVILDGRRIRVDYTEGNPNLKVKEVDKVSKEKMEVNS